MDLRRVGRLAGVLLASELRSGRSVSDPKSLLGRPMILGVIDVGVFVGVFALAFLGLQAIGPYAPAGFDVLAQELLVLVPILTVGAVLVTGIMFEFSTGARFATSDTVNWLPLTPPEYVAASTLAISLVYSPAPAFILGACFALALYLGFVPAFLLTLVLTVVALFQGGVLIEMLRALTQRAASALSGRKGRFTLVLRAALFLVVILMFQLAFNPILLSRLLGAVSGIGTASTFIPFFWSTRAIVAWFAGDIPLALAFAVAQVAFVGLLLYAAADLRVRLWAPAPAEVELEVHAFGRGHRTLSRLGLTLPEASLVWKDLVGLGRRREMLPFIVMPFVLMLVAFLQPAAAGSSFDRTMLGLWGGWISGFFALLLSITSIGQERRSVQLLFSFPLNGRALFRAKVAMCVALAGALGVGFDAVILAVLRPSIPIGLALLAVTATTVLFGTFLGLAVATRYSDFQERPRPQWVRPWAMIVALVGGIGIIFAIALPAAGWMFSSQPFSWSAAPLAVFAAVVGVLSVLVFYVLARNGANHFFDDLPQ